MLKKGALVRGRHRKSSSERRIGKWLTMWISYHAGGTTIEAEGVLDATERPAQSKWYLWRKSGTALIAYLLDSEVHTFAFSVAANAIISFIPFVVLLYTLALSVFHSQAMKAVVDDMVNYFLPSATKMPNWLANTIVAEAVLPLLKRHGAQVFSLVMILISCTGIFLPLEVALNQAWGVSKSRNYLFNQTIAFGLALLMVGLGVASMVANVSVDKVLATVLVHHSDNWFFRVLKFSDDVLSYVWLAVSTGVASIAVFLFGLLHAAQPQGAMAASAAHIDHHWRGLADFAIHLCDRAAAPGSGVALWAVLCFSGAAVLGVYLGADSVCGSAIQRGAMGTNHGRQELRREA